MENLEIFLAGVAAGLALYRYIMWLKLEGAPTACAHCQWKAGKRGAPKKW
jgi:hypothetical protein